MSKKTRLAVLLLGSIALLRAFGQEKPAAKEVPPPQDFSKEAYVYERHWTRMSAESDGTGTREVTAEVKMLGEAGVKNFAVINFTYTSANEVVDVDYVRVRKPDGTVVKTPDYNVQDMPGEVTRTAPLYSDVHEKHIAVKALSVGDTLEYQIRFRVVKPEVPGHFWHEYYFTKNAIVKDERLEISVPADKYVKVVSPDYKPEVKQEGGRRIYNWSRSNLAVKQEDPDLLPRRIPPNPDVQLTTFASWEEVGRWYASLQKDPLAVTPAIQAKAAELTKGLNSDEEKIRAIYNFVSLKFHYIGLDFGIGRYQPHAADDVLDNGYGDCKDKHTLLASLLKAAGYDAWPVLIHATRKLDPEVPSPAQFNHVITAVPGTTLIWLDSTPEVAPYRLLMPTLRNKQALVVPTNEPPKVMTTPENPPEPQRQEFSMSGKLDGEGTFTGHAEQTMEGDTAVLMRMAFRQVPESQWKELVQRISRFMNFGGDVSEVKVSPPDDIDKPFQISYDYVRKGFSDWENHHTSAALPPMGVEVAKDGKDRKPQEPLMLGATGTIDYRSRIQLPDGYSVVPPTPVYLRESFADYESRTNVEDGVMTTTRTMRIKKSEVALSEWEKFRKFGQAINDDEFNFMTIEGGGKLALRRRDSEKGSGLTKEPIDIVRPTEKLDEAGMTKALRDGEYALRQRDFQRAQELFEQVIASDPNYKGAHFDLGVALASRNNMPDAIEQFRKEEKISPENTRVYQILAGYLSVTGKRDEAIEEWRKLLKVDPQNRTAASELAGLLYRTEKYPEAVSVLEEAVKNAPDSTSLKMQLGSVYVKAGANDKAVAVFKQVMEEKGDDPETLNEAAYTLADAKIDLDLAQEWAEKAVETLDERAQAAASSNEAGLALTYFLSMTWDTLGWVYFEQGDLKQAEEYLRPAWLLGEEAVVGEHLGEVYEKEGKKELAARTYEYALAVNGGPAGAPGVPMNDGTRALFDRGEQIKARYTKLMGKAPTTQIQRLPNGQWTKTPAEQLRYSREVKLGNEGKLVGSAQFTVTFKPGKVESAEFDSGDGDLEVLAPKLKAAHYPIEFPPDSDAILVMHVSVRCKVTEGCVGSLVNPVPPGGPFSPALN